MDESKAKPATRGGSGSHASPLCTLLWAGGERDPGARPRWDKTPGKCLGTCAVGILWAVSLLVQAQFEIMNLDMMWGTTLTIKGKVASDADRFSINLGQGTDTLDLHFNPRFDESTIVCNSKDDNNWGEEQRNDLCFCPGSEVKVRSKRKGARGQCQRGSLAGREPRPRHTLALSELPGAATAGFQGASCPADGLPPAAAHCDLRE
ncbi:galectin-2 isoform X1 [Phyllostomus discolor]|uniref:Galectin n=1 Tax=Phyllostomus discolor TaxID=89673 RepID=A0A7E6DB43_9CHIR|nr:galectin-2 isoform X1 [Phyllostomus discolor]